MLYIVPTPIGNLKDITLRAIETLKEVDLILAEDTRVSKKLLEHFEISTPLKSFHAHNEHQQLENVLHQIRNNASTALVSDAGTPGISDPGFLLIRACLEQKMEVECLPGATAFVPALIMSGFPCDRFHFEGFLPRKKGRQTRLRFLTDYPHAIILYESPFRVLKTLEQCHQYFEDREICVARELTKIHQEVVNGSYAEVLNFVKESMTLKGEFVIVFGPKSK